jgi:Fe-S-cluster containining protein
VDKAGARVIHSPIYNEGVFPVKINGYICYLVHAGGEFLSFECSRCGECCSHLGTVHEIKGECGNNHFLVNNLYTGEKTAVTIDPDKISLFLDRSTFLQYPEACPFYRVETASSTGYCTVHQTRPEICRDFQCWRMLILNSSGERAGRIMCQRFLASQDEALTHHFHEITSDPAGCDDADWDERVIRALFQAGYTVKT